ncbi:inhibitor of nuclear factor kappa-B kinase subunit epsilon [Anabrus simplex]|uniref:inhibitor of nuclear factor kappa-B kinase subunit epsilon n=1 Tax=Anabrus simplex TaxID=316456 RepID=UPI0034DD1750
MSFLRGSANYVWCTTSVLGKGATGAVFQGVNKHNGEPVAVKTFNQLSHMRPHDVQVREFEVLKKVKHENIVKLLAIEEEQEGRGKVIVMELCTGGSLFNILDDPENTYGLQEEEFLLVLEHLSAGMKHLRDNNLVHRDLKPGNIMKFIADDGSTVYKLTDFGAARELEEDQQFMSLYGTEEYLHPDMYERAVLRKPVGKTFGATVDLWSIGVTLYHVATGNLPFRPFGGRRNKETMYYITTKKASGVISGSQTSENGPIDWSKELPNNCQLSAGLKKLVTPLLAGLLEVDSQRIWSFEKFFTEVTSILSRKLVHIFHVNKAQSIRVYLHPDETFVEFQCLVLEQTDVSPLNQILLFQDSTLLTIIEETTPGRGYPTTEEDKPIMLFSKENNNVTLSPDIDIPKFPTFPNLVSVENDASLAKTACSVGHVCRRRIEKFSRCSRLIHGCVDEFTAVVSRNLDRVSSKSVNLQELTRCVSKMTEAISRGEQAVHKMVKLLGRSDTLEGSEDWLNELSGLKKQLMSEIAPAIQQLHQRYVAERTLRREWSSATRGFPCPSKARAPARARTMLDRLRDSWQHLLRDRATRSLTYNDEQFHVLERIKVEETGRRLKSLLETECQPAVTQLAESLADWYKMAQTVYLQTQILDKDIDAYERRLEVFTSYLSNGDASFHTSLSTVLEKVEKDGKTSRTLGKQISRTRHDAKMIRESFKDFLVVREEIETVLKENSELVHQLKQITATSVEGMANGNGD